MGGKFSHDLSSDAGPRKEGFPILLCSLLTLLTMLN